MTTPKYFTMAHVACAALALCAALPLLAAPKHHPRHHAQPSAPPKPPSPSGVTVETRQAAPGEVATLYQALLLQQCPPAVVGNPDGAGAPGTAAATVNRDCLGSAHPTRFTVLTGPRQGYWEFPPEDLGFPPQDLPRTMARRIEFPAGATSYWAKVTITCEQASDACRQYASDTRRMSPPNPSSFVAPDSAQRKGWEIAIGNEPCEPGPAHTEAPEYPREALNNGITGIVVVDMLTNSCGDVREVRLARSSRDRGLDRATIEAARRWRLDLQTIQKLYPDATERFHWARAPVEFKL